MTVQTPDTIQEALATLIRERRVELGLTQTQFGQRIGSTQERISALENGKSGIPSLPSLARLASGLEMRLFELLEVIGSDEDDISSARTMDSNSSALLHTLQRLLAIPTTSLKDTLDEASDLLSEVMRVDKIDVLVYEPETDSLLALGTSNTPMGRRQHEIGMHRMPVANGGREVGCYQTGESYWSGQAKEDPGMLRGMTEGLGVQSAIIVPFEVAGRRRGVVAAVSSRQNLFVQDDVSFMLVLARWIGMVAERAELAEQITAETAEHARRAAAEELMTVLAHDLNNLLTPVKGHIELLQRRAKRDDRPQDLLSIDEAARGIHRLQQLIGELLDASRLEQGLFVLSVKPVDLVELIHDVVGRHTEAQHHIDLHLPELMVAQADASKLCQSLENLLSNAIHHNPNRAPITISLVRETRANGEWALIEIKDRGPGIDPDLLPTLFERFSKGNGSRGLGLGLYLARGVAHAHGGDLTVESQVGKGSVFRLALPLDQAEHTT